MDARTAPVQLLRHVSALAAVIVAFALPTPAGAAVAIDPDQTTIAEVGGNGNGALDPGEAFSLTEWLHSSEFTTLTGVSGVLSGGPAVTLSAAQSAYPDLLFGQPTANLTPFAGTIAATAECGAPLSMQLDLSTSGGSAVVPVSIPTGEPGAFSSADATDVPLAIPDPGTVSSTVSMPTAGRVKGLRVRIGELDHTYDGDLRLTLVAPDGTSVVLASNIGGSGDGYVGTVFDSQATTRITAGTPPYTGTFRPQGDLGALDGHPLQGSWQLQVTDRSPGDFGALVAWGIDGAPAVCAPVANDDPPGFEHRSDRARGQWPDPPGWQRHDLARHRQP